MVPCGKVRIFSQGAFRALFMSKIESIRKIEEESHTSGLTDRITQLLKEKKPIKVEETQQ